MSDRRKGPARRWQAGKRRGLPLVSVLMIVPVTLAQMLAAILVARELAGGMAAPGFGWWIAAAALGYGLIAGMAVLVPMLWGMVPGPGEDGRTR